jgi:hypothetical protein
MLAAGIHIEDAEIEDACRAFLDDASYYEVRDEIALAVDDIFARRAEELGKPYKRREDIRRAEHLDRAART